VYPDEQEAKEMGARIWVERAYEALAQNDLDYALTAHQEASRIWPEGQIVRELKGQVWIKRGDAALGRDDLNDAMAAYQQANNQQKIEIVERRNQWRPQHIVNGKYRIIMLVRVTGSCEIYQAVQLRPSRLVAIKRLRFSKVRDEETRVQFEREIAILGQIPHQFIASIGESEIGDRECYFVTEFANVGSLEDHLEAQPWHRLSPIEALGIAKNTCAGLEAIHRIGIVHRDVKPSNILLFSQVDGSMTAKISDFGIADVPEGFEAPHLPESFVPQLTLQYASPEQLAPFAEESSFSDVKTVDARSDLYSWALVVLEMVTGENPGSVLRDTVTLSVPDEVPLSFFEDREIPHELAQILHKVLYKDPSLRYSSATEIAKDLTAIRIPGVEDIDDHLITAEAHANTSNWKAADIEFVQGISLCRWYGRSSELPSRVAQLSARLRTGYLCAQAMISFAECGWKMAIRALEQLDAPDSYYLGVNLALHLELAQLEQKCADLEEYIQTLSVHGKWQELLDKLDELENVRRLIVEKRGIE
jgi:serine/threonine protein kinase